MTSANLYRKPFIQRLQPEISCRSGIVRTNCATSPFRNAQPLSNLIPNQVPLLHAQSSVWLFIPGTAPIRRAHQDAWRGKTPPKPSTGEAPAVNEAADHQTAKATQDQDGRIRFGNDRGRQAQEQPEEQSQRPPRPRQLHTPDDQPDGEAVGERSQQRRPFVREGHGNHHSDRESAEYHAGNHTPQRIRHGFPPCRGLTLYELQETRSQTKPT